MSPGGYLIMPLTKNITLPKIHLDAYWLAETSTAQLAEIYRLEPDPNPIALFDNTRFVAQREQGPMLFSLSADGQMIQALRARPAAFKGLLLTAQHPLEQLIQQLHSMLSVTFARNRKALLRFYDPLVASYLFPECTDQQLPRWLGPIHQLFWYGGTWSDIAGGHDVWHGLSQSEVQTLLPDQHGLVLTDEQEHALARQSIEKFAYDWLLQYPDETFGSLISRIQHGIAAGRNDEKSLTAWLRQAALQPKEIQG